MAPDRFARLRSLPDPCLHPSADALNPESISPCLARVTFVRVEADREASMRRQEQQQQHEQRMKRQESEKLLGIGLAGYLQRLSDLIGPGVPI